MLTFARESVRNSAAPQQSEQAPLHSACTSFAREIIKKAKDMEDLVLTIPVQDAALVETLAQRMGWTMRRRRTSVERFINSCPKTPQMTDEEIQAEINAYRQGL